MTLENLMVALAIAVGALIFGLLIVVLSFEIKDRIHCAELTGFSTHKYDCPVR